MDPILLAMLISSAAQGLSSAGTLIPNELDIENKRRLENLKNMQRSGNLGLTTSEQAAIENKLSGAANIAARQAQIDRNRLLAGSGGATGGQALQQAVASQQQQMATQTDIAGRVLDADLQKKQAQREEMRALEAAIAQRKSEKTQAVADVPKAALESFLLESANQAQMQGPKDVSPEALLAMQKTFNVSEEEARGLVELSIKNPDLFKMMVQLKRGIE